MRVKIVGVPKHQTGGKTPETMGLPKDLHHLANIEAEGGEVYQDQFGGLNKISDHAPSHEQGGVMIPNAERVLEDTSMDRKDPASKALKVGPEELDSIFGVKAKRPMSHARAYEYIKAQYGKQVDKFNTAQKGLNDKASFDRVKYNTARLNYIHRDQIPSDQDVFDTLFEHQEAIKAVHGIGNDGDTKKYGGYKYPKAAYGIDVDPTKSPDDLINGPKSKTKKGQITTEGKDVDAGADLTLDEFKQLWKEKGLDLDSYKTNKAAQRAVYNYIAKKDPEQIRQMWKSTGLTNLGRQNAAKLRSLGIDLAPNPRDPYHRLDVKDWDKLTPDQLKSLNDLAYSDDNFHIRTLTPGLQPKAGLPPLEPIDRQKGDPTTEFGPPSLRGPQPDEDNNEPGSPGFRPSPRNGFYEPTNWYDLAPGLTSLTDSFKREPELYNPVQIHELKYKQLNPTAALNANNSDYEAAIHELDNQSIGSGARAANLANLTAQKYKSNNQIMAEYENQNTGIKNREIDYNTHARDLQSMEDAKSRGDFYQKVLQSRDNQRLQKLQAIQDLSRAMQLKARQNRSGNLILQMTPHFDQNGQYNGNQAVFNLPPELMGDEGFIPQPQSNGARPVPAKSTTTTRWKSGDRTYTQTNQIPVQ